MFTYLDKGLPDFGFHVLCHFMAIFNFVMLLNLVLNLFLSVLTMVYTSCLILQSLLDIHVLDTP